MLLETLAQAYHLTIDEARGLPGDILRHRALVKLYEDNQRKPKGK